ncbi:MAG: class I SAM-dependent methyltransferase [Solirubrobacteraceae bacterium]|nr:class I SAM-dependent methyltransferase [Solirubrobacteraceae bacterium]
MSRHSDPAAAATWDRHAGRYARQEHLQRGAIEAALRLAAPRADERLVDLATGTGLLLRTLAARPDRPRDAIGVDRSPGMLAAGGTLPAGWTTLLADARAVPLPDGSADVVTCASLLHLLDAARRAEVLAEARRLLAPTAAARLVVVTAWVDRRRPGGRLAHATLALAARMRPAAWGGVLPLDPSADLRDAGFVVTDRVALTRGGYPSLVLAAAPGAPGS